VINKFYLLCVIFSGSPDLTLKTCLVYHTSCVFNYPPTYLERYWHNTYINKLKFSKCPPATLTYFMSFFLKALAKKRRTYLMYGLPVLKHPVSSDFWATLCLKSFSPNRAVNTLLLTYKKTYQLMLCREINVVCSEIHAKQINASSCQGTEFFIFKPCGTLTNQWVLNGHTKMVMSEQQIISDTTHHH